MFKKLISLVFTVFSVALLFGNIFAMDLNSIEENFVRDSFHFKFDMDFISSEEKKIIESYNRERGTHATDIMEIPRDYLIPKILPLHDTSKMICYTQCIYYSELFKRAGISNYIIHIQLSDSTAHDNLIYMDPRTHVWKLIDFTGGRSVAEKVKNRYRMLTGQEITYEAFCRSSEMLLNIYFRDTLENWLKSSRGHWLAVAYYDGNDRKDLGDLSPDLNELLKELRYPCVRQLDARHLVLDERK